MSSIRQVGSVVLALAVVVASEAAAQQRTATPATRRTTAQTTATQRAASSVVGSWELGTDMDVGIGLSDPKSFFIDIPTGVVRAGYYATEVLTLEPALSFHSFAQKNATAFSSWMLRLGALYHLSPDRTKDQLFIHPAIGLTGGSGNNPTFLSAGVGLKHPMLAGRMATRMEVGLDHRLKSGPIDSQTSLMAFLGWSVYTR
jgi:hypothetical protein